MIISKISLPNLIRQQFYLKLHGFAEVENVVNSVADGEVDVVLLVGFKDTFATVVAFCYHFHFEHCRLQRISLSEHYAKGAVAAEF